MERDDVKLESINFASTNYNSLSSVECTLTNGESECFESDTDWYHLKEKSIDFKGKPRIRAVSATRGNDFTTNIAFWDANDNEIARYNPGNDNDKYSEKYELKENQELIGIYGVQDKCYWLTSFGFLIKVRQHDV